MKSKFVLFASLLAAAALAVPAMAHEGGTWIVRGGAGMVSPKSGNLAFPDVDLGDGDTVTNASIEVDDGTSLVLSATYMINDNWAVDILGAWPFEHDIDLTGTVNGTAVTAPIGSTKHLPPTVSLQYHFAPESAFQPFVGLGVNYTMFMSESVTSDAQDIGLVDIELEDSTGIAAQVGADWVFNDNWLVNFDVRWIQIRSNLLLTIDDGTTVTSGIDVPGNVEIDPWVFAINVGYKFD